MIKLKDGSYVYDYCECPDDIDFVNYSFKKQNFSKKNPALRIYFKNDLKHNVKIIKDLIKLKKNNISFCSMVDGRKVRYIISNYPKDDVIMAFKALYINDRRHQVTYIYDSIIKQLDEIWSNINPCGFCNNVCIGIKHGQSPGNIDGCCYSFDYPKHPLFSIHFIENIKKCKHFDATKKMCSTKNISCKFYVCEYIKKSTSFNLKVDDFLLVNSFFNKKQKLIIHYNYFRTREEIIDKLLSENRIPYCIYYWFNYYRISKSKK